ncbi:hypothetical protein Bcop_2132 [Bacteroides coprosuis DSM 18011]|uniref:Uncharacterized protein n=1 Tax=Bacteroides coprosuis DSM 18011 TaxID=679937 RepID=F3ZTR8_9BACE|nr:hypothetical protein [Bacteroides coprosuis]EGJ72302.1 hypothetical protein Bcop_2132 [Bacteroides coprosuis DSM 18011]
MKKLYTTEKYKKTNKRHAKRSLKQKLAHKEYRRQKNISEIGLSQIEREHKRKFENPFKDYVKIHAPNTLSFIDNSNEVVNFIDKLKHQFDLKNKVFVVLKDVQKITYDAIVVLLSIMVEFKSNRIAFNGDFPENKTARKILEESKFLQYLYEQFRESDRYHLGQKSSIHTHAWKDVDSELGSQLIRQATKTVWGEERRCQGVQRTLIELMLNTNNHADDSKKGEKHWWLSVHHDTIQNKVSFAFIDFGVGVFTSLNNKRSNSKFYGILDKLKERVKYGNNAELLSLILDGTLHKTATNKPYHGKGLPGIQMALNRNQISNLNIITNNVHANVEKNDFQSISKSFSGTFVYWELNKNNISCHGIDRN